MYKVEDKDCGIIYIGETKFKMKKRIDQHKKDVQFRRTLSSAIARHVEQSEHEMDWDSVECLENEKRTIPRKILESVHMRANRERCFNLNEGIGVTYVYGKGNWLRRQRQKGLKKEKQAVFISSALLET